MELYAAVRRSVYVEGWSERAAARRVGLARETVRKMLRYRLPPGYRRQKPIRGIVRLIRLDPKNLQSRTIRLQVDATRPGRRLGLV